MDNERKINDYQVIMLSTVTIIQASLQHWFLSHLVTFRVSVD